MSEQSNVPTTLVFKKYATEDREEIAFMERHGIRNVRLVDNSGGVPIQSENGAVCKVFSQIDRKRNTPYDAPDERRDAIAERIVRSWNMHDDLVVALKKALKPDLTHEDVVFCYNVLTQACGETA